jgi:two-component sensor histidine kinase
MAVPDNALTVQNAYLTRMLVQAGLDAEAQVVAARIQSVLTDEIHHRMKNMLTMVTAIVRQSMRSATNVADAEAAISTRLIAMARAHDLLLKAELQSAGLENVIRGAIEQHNTAAGRIAIEGAPLQVTPSSILPLTLILNELCTNATKYGALSNAKGHVGLTWSLDAKSDALILHWTEMDGPSVAPPGPRSFGTRLIEDALPRQLGGKGRLTYAPAGVEFELTVPYANLKPILAV